ncbi:hypothetical protein ACW9KT_17540 [Hymenobacter sp. HD11105]
MLLLEPLAFTHSAQQLQRIQQLPSSFTNKRYQKLALVAVIVLGILFRLFHFFHNRSLFIDELYLDVNIIKMTFWELATLPFEYEQKAPIGYLWAAKLFVILFGKGEKALRSFSLICGISSLFLFIPVARFYLKSWGVVLAVGILSLGWTFIYHSVEAKQYSTELFATILALFLYIRYHKATDAVSLVKWGILGGGLLWFSFSLIFILAGVAGAISLNALFTKQWKRLLVYMLPFSLWAISFCIIYYLFISKYQQSGWLIDFFKKIYDGFMPLPPTSLSDVAWFIRTPYSMLHHPLGLLLNLDGDIATSNARYVLKLGWLSVFFIALGMFTLLKENKVRLFILFLPIIITFLASGFKFYPVYGRFVLFLTPLIIIFLAVGVERISIYFYNTRAIYCLTGVFLSIVAINSIRQVITPSLLSGATERETILYVNDNFEEGDAVYIFWNMRHAYGYYKEAYKLKYIATQASYVKNISTSAEDYIKNLSQDFENFRGKKRLWFVYDPNNVNHIGDYVGQPQWYHDKDFHAEQLIEKEFFKFGKRIKHICNKKNGLSISLFELSEPEETKPAENNK